MNAKVGRVIVGTKDPNPKVDGRGLRALKRAGIEVVRPRSRLIRARADALIAPFLSATRQGRPHVVLKVATSLDGRVAAASGDARWVTGSEARGLVHLIRDRVDAIVVAAGTVRTDDPELTVRVKIPGRRARHPRRVVLDGKLSTSPDAKVYARHRADRGAPIVVHTKKAPRAARERFDAAGIERVVLGHGARVDVATALTALCALGIQSVLVEPGPRLAGAFFRAGVVDELWWFRAPKVVGGDGVPVVDTLGHTKMADVRTLSPLGELKVGVDLLDVFAW